MLLDVKINDDPLDVIRGKIGEDVFTYSGSEFVPISHLVKSDTTQKEVELMVLQRMRDWKRYHRDVLKYKWFSIRHGPTTSIVRVSIVVNEYISEIILFDEHVNELGRWNINMGSERRDYHVLPGTNGQEWYGKYSRVVRTDDKVTLHRVVGRGNNIELSEDDWNRWLDGDNILAMNDVNRINFLENNIIELISNNRHIYYGILNVFSLLYNEGYWTYGGLIRPNTTEIINIKYDYNTDKSYRLTTDGRLSLITPLDDEVKEIMSNLKMLGAKDDHVINSIEEFRDIVKKNRLNSKNIWFVFTNGAVGDIVMRVTIVADEYITDIMIYNTNTNETNTWNIEDEDKKRDVNSLPQYSQFYWYGNDVRIRMSDRVPEHRKNNEWTVMTEEEWNEMMKNDPIQFLENNIIEQLTDNRNLYYGILHIFNILYRYGYWTYGGLRVVKGSVNNTKLRSNVVYKYARKHIDKDAKNGSFNLSTDGTISNADELDYKGDRIVEDLISLGAKVVS